MIIELICVIVGCTAGLGFIGMSIYDDIKEYIDNKKRTNRRRVNCISRKRDSGEIHKMPNAEIIGLYGELGWLLCWVTDDSQYADAIIKIDDMINAESYTEAKIAIVTLAKQIVAGGNFIGDASETLQKLIDNPDAVKNLLLDDMVRLPDGSASPTLRVLLFVWGGLVLLTTLCIIIRLFIL